MALNIRHPEADRLARKLAGITGETITAAIIGALRFRLEHERRRPRPQTAKDAIRKAQQRLARIKVLDPRSPEEIIGYDKWGLPR